MSYIAHSRHPVSRVENTSIHKAKAGSDQSTKKFSPNVPKTLQHTVGNRGLHRLIQTKLRIGKPGDRYEQEADRIADLVTRMPEPGTNRQPT